MKENTYSIGKVSKLVDLPQSVLRFWETEFEQLNPEKSDGGTRIYKELDISLILQIKDLLYQQKFTIAGAKTELQGVNTTGNEQESHISRYLIKELQVILDDLES